MDITTSGRRRTGTALTTGITAAVALAAVSAPGAIARPAEPMRTAAADRALAERGPSPRVDLRTPDAIDAAQSSVPRVAASASPVKVVRTGNRTSGGFDWGDAAIGAGGTIAAIALGGCAAVALTRRRLRPTSVSNAADAAL
jgi:hypothetical protein